MRQLKQFLKRIPFAVSLVRLAYRTRVVFAQLSGFARSLMVWLIGSRESSNYTYKLTSRNMRYLASQLADMTGRPYDELMGYIVELETDQHLLAHLDDMVRRAGKDASRDPNMPFGKLPYGRRLGWYALARVTKPKVVVETGVEKGLGSCVLTAAIARNTAEGYTGRYYGFDINPKAGYLLDGMYAQYGEVIYGDAISNLQKFDRAIDLYVNDSDHLPEYEASEYEAVANKLSPRAIMLGDNAHATDELLNFALATGRQFIFFKEQPADHWYPGAGIGIAFRRPIGQTRERETI